MNMLSERSPLFSVADVAARLGVRPSRVRALAESGDLRGRKVGRRWVFAPSDVDAFAARPRVVGRPLSPQRALGLLFELSGVPAPWLDREARWKVLHAQAAIHPDLLVARARRRATRLECRAHPSDLPRLLAEQGVVRGGVSAAAELGIDLVAPGVVEVYIDGSCAHGLIKRYSLRASDDPNVILHVADVPQALEDRAIMPLGVAVVDLLESGEPRAVAAARRAWDRLQQQ